MKELKDYTWVELVEESSSKILTAFIESGGKGFKGTIWQAMEDAIRWRKEKDKQERELKKSKKRKK